MRTKIVENKASQIQTPKQAALMFFQESAVLKYNKSYYRLNEISKKIELVSTANTDANTKVTWYIDGTNLQTLFNNCDKVLYEEVEVKWYDDIPEQGVLCTVYNVSELENIESNICLVIGYDKKSKLFKTICESYRYAEPLTLDELKEYIYEN